MFRFFGQYVPAKSVILMVTESMLIVASLWMAAWIRLGQMDALASEFDARFTVTLKLGCVILVCLVCFYYNDLYDLQVISRRAELLVRLIQCLGVASLILALLYYLVPDLMFGRGISALAALVTGVTLVIWRLVVDAAGSFFRPAQRLLVAGTGKAGIRLVQELITRPELNIKVLGFLDEEGKNIGRRLVNPGVIGSMSELEGIIRKEKVDRVVLSFAEPRGQMPVQQLLHVKFSGTQIEDAHSLYEKITGRIMLEKLTPSWLILSEGFRKSSHQMVIKRVIDILISVSALMLFSPILLLVAIAIYCESGPPTFFRQERVGLGGRRFFILKFRSMRQDAEKHGPAWASADDDRITRVGRVIRRYHLDEIPQFINVLYGDMSVVGPRPEQPAFVDTLEQQITYYGQRHTARPGITGWAQIKYRYGSSHDDAKNKLEYELFYIKHMSVLFDLLIIFRTLQVMLFARGSV
jgi:sugar transferase (PEP-CTERM system associated)